MKMSLTALALVLGLSLNLLNTAKASNDGFDLCRDVAQAYNSYSSTTGYQCASRDVGFGGEEVYYVCSGGGQTWQLVSTDEGCRGYPLLHEG